MYDEPKMDRTHYDGILLLTGLGKCDNDKIYFVVRQSRLRKTKCNKATKSLNRLNRKLKSNKFHPISMSPIPIVLSLNCFYLSISRGLVTLSGVRRVPLITNRFSPAYKFLLLELALISNKLN